MTPEDRLALLATDHPFRFDDGMYATNDHGLKFWITGRDTAELDVGDMTVEIAIEPAIREDGTAGRYVYPAAIDVWKDGTPLSDAERTALLTIIPKAIEASGEFVIIAGSD